MSLKASQKKLTELLGSRTPLMDASMLRDFVAAYLDRRNVYLEAVQKHGSPLYLQELEVLRNRATRFKQVFQAELRSPSFFYAVKSNNHPTIARTVLEHGYGLDVSSGVELEMALNLGAENIIFSGPGKTGEELTLAAANRDRVVVLLDSFGELERLAALAAAGDRPVRCGVRLCVKPTGLWRKFGIPLSSLADFWAAAERYPAIDLSGLQFHSSWNLHPGTQVAAIETVGTVISGMPAALRSKIEFIDIGGGYWPEQGEWLQPLSTPEGALRKALGEPPGPASDHHLLTSTPIASFAREIGAALDRHLYSLVSASCRIYLEPGRWICNDAVHLLFSVVDKKDNDLVITDAGTNAVGWERFESDYFPVLNLSKPALNEIECQLMGSLCTPHDIWGTHYFGSAIEPGDVLMIPTQGAYTYSLRQNFIKPLPKTVAI